MIYTDIAHKDRHMIKPFFKINLVNARNLLFFILACSIFLFNFTFKTNLNAVDSEILINIENLLTEHNKLRAERGLPILSISKLLNSSATLKAQSMLKTDCWSHYCPEGTSPWEFFDSANYRYRYAGENLAEGFYNIKILMDTWMNSESHKNNILNANFDEIGFAVLSGAFQNNANNILVVVHFGKRDVIENEPFIRITEPLDGQVIKENYIEVNGTASDINQVSVNLDGKLEKVGNVENGAYTVRFDDIDKGPHFISVTGVDEFNNIIKSNLVNISINSQEILNDSANSKELNISLNAISPELKNNINFVFLFVIGILFIVDLFIFSKISALKRENSFSHYHLILLIITGIAIAVGSFGGRVMIGAGI